VGGLLSYNLQRWLKKLVNTTNDSWWKFHSDATTQVRIEQSTNRGLVGFGTFDPKLVG
jgi:hypothetical protein